MRQSGNGPPLLRRGGPFVCALCQGAPFLVLGIKNGKPCSSNQILAAREAATILAVPLNEPRGEVLTYRSFAAFPAFDE
jgi:hypothetical protein